MIVTGANGIGKSSLLRTLAGLVSLSGGEVRAEDGMPDAPPGEHMHYFGHADAVKPALTVLENLHFWQHFTAAAAVEGFEGTALSPVHALTALGIDHTAQLPAAYLSAGQKRRLSLARLLVTQRPVWLLDEPTSALDAASETLLLSLMNGHLQHNGLIVAATHAQLAPKGAKELHLTATEQPDTVHQEDLQ